ncbi:DUF4129 domain-containing protein [Streptomyces albipurpureus]|uniref:DUF4129 domain-containing protein n=1 Tax=Streptomyces albipurpureus TaxID=2897419 RepID=UPI003CE5662D
MDTPRVPAREAAEQELSRPEYHENDPHLLQRAIDRFWEWVGDAFSAASTAAPGGLVGLIVIVLVTLALLTALWWRLGSPRRAPGPVSPLFDDAPRSAAEHRAAAEVHAAATQWTPAVQEQMRAIVRSLEERDLLEPRPGRTADEAAADGSLSLPGHSPELHAAARDFDDVTYGGRTATRDVYLRLRKLDEALERTSPRLTGAASGAGE